MWQFLVENKIIRKWEQNNPCGFERILNMSSDLHHSTGFSFKCLLNSRKSLLAAIIMLMFWYKEKNKRGVSVSNIHCLGEMYIQFHVFHITTTTINVFYCSDVTAQYKIVP